ncbi:MAG: hypothetical protein QXX15_01880, partial [Desulfurococcaceae archaeon]
MFHLFSRLLVDKVPGNLKVLTGVYFLAIKPGCLTMVKHWIDELADQLYEKLTGRGAKEVYVFNGGLSVSGLQHVGRLRGEIIIGETLRRILTARGL